MSSSTRPSALQAIIEAYARAKGVTLPAGDLTTIQNIFILIDKTEPSKIVMIPTEILASKQPLALPASKQPLALPASKQPLALPASKQPLALPAPAPNQILALPAPSNIGGGILIFYVNIFGKTFEFNSIEQLVRVLNVTKNPRIVGNIRMQIDGKIVRFFDATNTEVDTIYTAKSAKDFKEICDAFGGKAPCAAIMAQCAIDSFDDQCKENIKDDMSTLNFSESEKDTTKLIQAYAFLQKLNWKRDANTGKLQDVDSWIKTQSTIFKNVTNLQNVYYFLKNIVTALNASNVPKELNTKAGQVSTADNFEEIMKAVAEGRLSESRFLTPYGPFAYMLKGGGLDAKASEKLQAQFTKLIEILTASGKTLASNTMKAITDEINNIKTSETIITSVIKSLSDSKNLDELAKQVVAVRDGLKTDNGTPLIDANGKPINDFLAEFTKAYEKMHVSIGKVAGAFSNAYIIFGKFTPKASEVTADSLVSKGNNAPRPRWVPL